MESELTPHFKLVVDETRDEPRASVGMRDHIKNTNRIGAGDLEG